MAVLTRTYRPKVFEEVIGQTLAVKILRAVAKNPEKSPKSLVLSGPWGTGKTTLARVFGRALSCDNFSRTGKICLTCEGCRRWDDVSNKYIEYDSSMIGSVSQIRELRPVFEMSTDFYRVIVLDECHLVSRQAQSALLKVIEEGPLKTFFILCSTDPEMILDTIHSRSLPVDFYKVDNALIVEYLQEIVKKEGSEPLDKDLLDKIAFKSDGHVRDAVMLLEGYLVSGETDILNLPLDDITEFFVEVGQGRLMEAVSRVQKRIMKYPVHQVHRSLNYVVLQLVATESMGLKNKYTQAVVSLRGRSFDVFKTVSDNWAQGVFDDKYLTAAFFLTLVRLFGKP